MVQLDGKNFVEANDGHKFIFVCIDCFSRFAYAIALKDKSAKTVSNAMEKIFKTGQVPYNIQSDHGIYYFTIKKSLV